MNFRLLSENEFDEYSQNHPLTSFHQSSNWAKVKASNGWNYEFVGIEDENGLCGAALLLSKTMARVFKMYYSPRGFLLDYQNKKLVKEFTAAVKEHVKKQGGIFFKIDPYLDERELDLDGEVVENGYDNRMVKSLLQDYGYHYLVRKDGSPKTTMIHSMFVLEFHQQTADELFKQFSKHVKQSIKNAMKYGVQIEDLTYDQLPRFKAMLQKTADRRGFIDRPLSYYQQMYQSFATEGKMIFRMATLNMDVYQEQLQQRYEKAQNVYDRLFAKKEQNPESSRYDGELKEALVNLEASKKRLDEVKEVVAVYGKIVDLSCACYFLWGNEILNLYGGNEEELLKYGGQYLLHWDMINKAIDEGYSRYNFYGIPDILDKEDKDTYGVYLIKRGFHGKVSRLLGEFDYVISPVMYQLYQFALKVYNKVR